jgi:hypothetical protein
MFKLVSLYSSQFEPKACVPVCYNQGKIWIGSGFILNYLWCKIWLNSVLFTLKSVQTKKIFKLDPMDINIRFNVPI